MARVIVFGGHGKVALQLARILTERGDRVSSVFRNPDQSDDVAATGAEPVVADIERLDTDALADLVSGHDAVVFSAGAGGGNPDRTYAVDRDAAIRVIDAAAQAGVKRFVMVSYFGAGPDHGVPQDDPFSPMPRPRPPPMPICGTASCTGRCWVPAGSRWNRRPARSSLPRERERYPAPTSRSSRRPRSPTIRPSGGPSNSTTATSRSLKRWRTD